jgi:hypothetical protein
MDSPAIAVRRVALVAGVTTVVYPPRECNDVTIGNATGNDITIYSTPDDATRGLIVADGFERQITVRGHHFRSTQPAFWLKAVASGDVVLTWV